MIKQYMIDNNPVEWLLESNDVGVQYLAMRDLIEIGANELRAIKKRAHNEGQIAHVLAKMEKEGYWEQPGAGYYPKYKGTVWSVILLAQLGASVEDNSRIATACSYLLEHTLTEGGHFTVNGLPSGTADCLQGNLCWALVELRGFCISPRKGALRIYPEDKIGISANSRMIASISMCSGPRVNSYRP